MGGVVTAFCWGWVVPRWYSAGEPAAERVKYRCRSSPLCEGPRLSMELECAAGLRSFRRYLRSSFSAQSATNNPATTPATGTLTRARRIADRGRRSGQAQLLPVGETRRWTGRVDVGRAGNGCGMAPIGRASWRERVCRYV